MSLDWREVHFGNAAAPTIGLAGRSDDAPSSRGDAVGAVVQAGMGALNSWSTDVALAREIRRHEPWVEQAMEGHEYGGILVVATYDNVRYGDMTGQRVDGMEIVSGIYEHPRHAYYRWSHAPRMSGVAGEPSYRFFWVTRAGHW